MRGWKGEPRRHALAARGIRTICSVPVERDKYVGEYRVWGYPTQDEETPEEFTDELLSTLDGLCRSKQIKLYRVIWPGEHINMSRPGIHYVAKREYLTPQFLEDLHHELVAFEQIPADTPLDSYKILVVEMPSVDIDVKETLEMNFEHPYEREVTLKDDKNAIVVEVI